jgi:colanic acid/amylovoran biosynthesis glycosyltransferase
MPSNIKLAILSPNGNAYSETFIQAHKQLPFDVKYYFNGFVPNKLEEEGLFYNSVLERNFYKLNPKRKTYSFAEHKLMQSLKNKNINCVLAEYGTTAAESLNVLKKLNIPLVVHFHGYDATMEDFVNKYKKKYIEVFEYAKAIIVVSNKMYKDVLALGCSESKMHLITYGPNNSFFDIKASFNNSQFIAVGRFVDKKAPYLTIAAFKDVLNKHPEAKLIMAGDGPLLNTCVNLAKAWKIDENVIFTGPVPPAEIIKYFESSLAFVQHSVIAGNGDSEGAPVAVFEASAAGLPIIASKHAGIPDIVIDRKTGLLFDELDIQAMAGLMIELLDNKAMAQQMGETGRQHIKENFPLSKHLSGIESLIRQAVA